MKKIFMLVAILILGCVGLASATTFYGGHHGGWCPPEEPLCTESFSYTDSGPYKVTQSSPFNKTYDLVSLGVLKTTDTVESADLSFRLSDNCDFWLDWASVKIDDVYRGSFSWGDHSFDVLSQVTDKILTLVIEAKDIFGGIFAEFYVKDITIAGCDAPAPVPEPATFVLLGSGLVGLALYRRKRMK